MSVLSIKFQLFIATSVWVNFFTFGLWLGSPTVVIPQLRREANTTAVVSDEMESWLSSVVGYAGLPWAVIFPLCMRRYGRKFPFIFASACALTSFIVYCSSSTAIQILAAEIIEGVIFASNSTVSMLVITEYTSPRHRGLFLTLKAASMNIAICIANAIGTFFHWKKIPILGTVCAVYSFSAIFWPESPYWLASKGRFAECMASHRWLKGTGDEAEKELKDLIQAQIEYQESHTNQHVLLKIHSTILKISPFIFKTCDMHGTFLFFGISFSICIYLFYAFLPETKDKTLQEIENCFKDNSEKGDIYMTPFPSAQLLTASKKDFTALYFSLKGLSLSEYYT
ncbi:facilitated trehalose transporter Tret1-like [Choristoneura fumiferana]|uniref:facilitated trehalose transporter Tret1-like n=1 Tax=Choristoneura fumiferana TaxID=7141 RepID=UPI003D15C92D